MNSVTELFSRIKKTHVEKAVGNWPKYRDLLIALAQDKQVEPDDAEAILANVGKGESELADDVGKMKTRIAAQARYSQLNAAKAAAAAAEKKLETLKNELIAHQQSLQPKIDSANSELRAAQTTHAICASSHLDLIRTCLNPEILIAENELKQRRSELQQRREFLLGILNEGLNHSPVNLLTYAKSEIETLKARIKSLKKELAKASGNSSQHIKRQCDDIQQQIDAQKKHATTLGERVANSQAELKRVLSELETIETKLQQLQDRRIKEL